MCVCETCDQPLCVCVSCVARTSLFARTTCWLLCLDFLLSWPSRVAPSRSSLVGACAYRASCSISVHMPYARWEHPPFFRLPCRLRFCGFGRQGIYGPPEIVSRRRDSRAVTRPVRTRTRRDSRAVSVKSQNVSVSFFGLMRRTIKTI